MIFAQAAYLFGTGLGILGLWLVNTGAVPGDWLMGMDMAIMSLFGFFALAGIVINDSIILIMFYQQNLVVKPPTAKSATFLTKSIE